MPLPRGSPNSPKPREREFPVTCPSRPTPVRSGTLLLALATLGVAAEGPGIGNLTYTPHEVLTVISQINETNGAPSGHSLVAMHNGWLAVIGSKDGGKGDGHLSFFDVSDPRKPVLVHHQYDAATRNLREAHTIGFTTWKGRSLAVLQGMAGIQVWDWSDPRAPALLSDTPLPPMKGGDYGQTPWWTSLQFPYLYVGGLDTGLHIVDLRDPAKPVVVARIPPAELGGILPATLFAVGNLLVAMAVEGNRGLVTLSIADPLRPMVLDRIPQTGKAYAGMFNGTRFVMASKNPLNLAKGEKPPEPQPAMTRDVLAPYNAVHVYDLTHPEQIVYLGNSGPAGGQGGYVAIQDGRAYVGMSTNFALVDLTRPDGFPVLTQVKPGKTAALPNPKADYDFCTPLANLIVSSSDHGDGSYLLPAGTDPDRTPPAINRVIPAPGATQQARTSRVGLTVTDALDNRSLTSATVFLRPVGGAPVEAALSYQTGIINLSPVEALAAGTTYELVVPAGGLRDLGGNAVATTFTSRFTTAP